MDKNKKLKIMTIFGTRPEIIRLSRVFAEFDKYVNHIMVHTGQSYDYEMNQVFFENLKVRKPDCFLEVKSETLGGQIAKIIEKSEEVLKKEMPDAVLILGDTNSTLAAIVAKRMKIPIFHMEAGNRSFDENVPEETNRRIVDHISDINLSYSENARLYLIQEGIHPGTIYVTGSPLGEIYNYYKKDIDKSNILKELKLSPKKYFVASIHREENVENKESLTKLIDSLNAVAEIYKMPIVVSAHPRTAKRLAEYKFKINKLINFHKPFGYFDYGNLQLNAFCVLSDSGTIHEESSIMGFSAIQVRVSSERPEAFDEGVAILSGLDKDVILQSIDITVKQIAAGKKFNVPAAYRVDNVSSKVLRLVVGLTKIIQNKRGFRK
ncbi:UDP-N-acetylglucosamine 2-epimerase (non-hydrolyzing) [Candidatus Wolfebacteria bacterium CG03_land_8_20_14_0_80_40_12]|uniref:UDP-N-acetylglucosamine 2-epimerase (Non-hydrolyzing) n=1 Tax=Candidatus Wolfebacteria bacterium CG03_land_8_20_14_0_80_40_12 TaxID=1975069 RepID=A0A2M7B6A1_9BACT|nr:MAG: UDP-N-acetylglucosamine 2-epimerase (non-hydrolyzing) [Candidatus Wolfebacteria bacterium CG03_land_8_20_14_0_80_40_12]